MRLCYRCVLPDTFPGIRMDEEGVCNLCRETVPPERRHIQKAEYRERFEHLIREQRCRSGYDVLLCYSGGKDSTFALAIMKERYGLNVLALTMDNGFMSPQALTNIRSVTDRLGIDHLLFAPRFDTLASIFRECAQRNIYPPKTLERASAICTSCMSIVRFSALRLAIEKRIPLIAYGWSPGQAPITSSILKNNPQMVKLMQQSTFGPLHRIAGDAIRPYFLSDEHFNAGERFPYNVHPLAFLDYDESTIYREIGNLGWSAVEDTDTNSTNCLLNSFAIYEHKRQFGFHPYAFELAGLVREGHLERSEAIARLTEEPRAETISAIRSKLGLPAV
jgi:tRNA(Ile)-lysidine synthase TilS/MesJ